MTIEMEYSLRLENFKFHYSNVTQEFLTISKPHIGAIDLNALKNHYSSIINSVRTSDYINSLEGLLKVLEKRNALSYENIEPLKYISSKYVRDPVLERLLMDYEGHMTNRPHVPLINVYDLPNGKYIVMKRPCDTWFVSLEASNKIVHFRKNHNETTNQDETICNNGSEHPTRILSSSEDITINETEHFVQNKVTELTGERWNNFYDITSLIGKVCHKITCNCISSRIFLLVGVFIIVVILICNVNKSPAPLYEAQPGISGVGANTSGSRQSHQIRAEMTLYTTTQPAFRITLPGSVEIGQPGQHREEDDAEIQRMVFLEVSDKLGRHWRDVARFLGVTENDIDEIDYNLQMQLKEKAFKALLKFQTKCDPHQWKPKLKRALEKARRKDLMEMVDELSSRKHRTI